MSTPKLLLLVFALCWAARPACAQEPSAGAAPGLRLTLTIEKTVWKPGEAAPVRIKIENISGGPAEIPQTVLFRADNRASEGGGVTTADGVFWSPVSLTKVYAVRAEGCQNDLTPERVETPGGTNVVAIYPARTGPFLAKSEAREFGFELAGTCWGHSIVSFYPSDTIFSSARKYRPNIYRVYFEMELPRGKVGAGGKDAPTSRRLRSNAVEVAIY